MTDLPFVTSNAYIELRRAQEATQAEAEAYAERVYLDPHPYDEDVPECPEPEPSCVVCPYHMACHPVDKQIEF